jgi:hypothetical protein
VFRGSVSNRGMTPDYHGHARGHSLLFSLTSGFFHTPAVRAVGPVLLSTPMRYALASMHSMRLVRCGGGGRWARVQGPLGFLTIYSELGLEMEAGCYDSGCRSWRLARSSRCLRCGRVAL